MNDTIKSLLKNLIELMVKAEFSEIVDRNENGRLSAADIATTLREYPGTLSTPPDNAYDSMCIYDVYDSKSEARQVEFDLWFDNEISDLTLSVDVRKNELGKFVISIDDIHVL